MSALFLVTGVVSARPVLISGMIENTAQYFESTMFRLGAINGYPAHVLFHRDGLKGATAEQPKKSNFIMLLPEGESATIAMSEWNYEYCRFTITVDSTNHAVLSDVVSARPAAGAVGCTISGDVNDDTFTIHLASDSNA